MTLLSGRFMMRAAVGAMLTLTAAAQAAVPINTKGSDKNVAIHGYDPVGYFVDSKPEAGLDQYTYEWKGATWKFASQEHLDKFKAMPEHYAPQYGGYCAYGVSKDHLAPTDPQAWTVRDDKLYLNYDLEVQEAWLKDPAKYIKEADAKYPVLLKN